MNPGDRPSDSGPTTTPPKLLDFNQERIRTLHYTWIAFFMTFYIWFNLAPLATTMLDTVGWLTKEHVKILMIANVALTIPARIVVGALIDRFGARIVFTALMISMAIPTVAFAMGNSFMQMLIATTHLELGRCRLRDRYQDDRPMVPTEVHRSRRGVLRWMGQLRLGVRCDDAPVVRHLLPRRLARPR